MLTSEVKFKLKENATIEITNSTQAPTTETPIDEDEKSTPRPKHPHIYKVFVGAEDPSLRRIQSPAGKIMVDNDADYQFIMKMEIDVPKTHWGYYTDCEYVLFYPLFCGIVSVLWGTMLILFRGGGKENYGWGIPQPWRIVLPSIIIFSLMTILSLIYTLLTQSKFKGFCMNLKGNLTSDKLKCGDLISTFQLTETSSLFNTSNNYNLLILFSIVTLIAWLVALLVMLTRCLFVVDFHLVRVTLTTISDPKKPTGSEMHSSLDSSTRDLRDDIEKPLRSSGIAQSPLPSKVENFSSKEDLDDFESAVSDTEMSTFTIIENPSLEPLLHQRKALSSQSTSLN